MFEACVTVACRPLQPSLKLKSEQQPTSAAANVNSHASKGLGGESGPAARPMHPDWPRQIHNECSAAHVPFFFKQWGEYRPSPLGTERTMINIEPDGRWERSTGLHSPRQPLLAKVGKKAAGRLLDGLQHDGMPR